MNTSELITRRAAIRSALAAVSAGWLGGCGGGADASADPGTQEALASMRDADALGVQASSPTTQQANSPRWAAAAESASWVEVPVAATLASRDPGQDASINPNYPSRAPWDPSGARQAAIVYAWCGAVFDEASDTYWIGPAGGHGDYGGNEIYRGTFHAASPTWSLVRKPSGAIGNTISLNDGGESGGVYSDGRPRAMHTYNRQVYVPGVGPVMCGIAGVYSSGSGGKRVFAFIGKKTGEARFSSECTLYMQDYLDGAGACYDSRRHALWLFPKGTSAAVRYDIPTADGPHKGLFHTVGAAASKLGYVSATYLPDDDCILIGTSNYAEDAGSWMVLDCADGRYYTPMFSGSGALGSTQGQCQPRWVPSLGAACAWNNAASTTLITRLIKPANPRTGKWIVDTLPVSGANTVVPTAKTANGTFGRFAYSSRMGGFLVFNSTSGPTYFYKI